MKRIIAFCSIALCASAIKAQIPEDVLKYSWGPINASARINAIGGANGSLGGDLSALYINPAGLGFYRTSDLVISPGFSLNTNTGKYRGSTEDAKKNRFSFGPTGVVIGSGGENGSNWKGHSFAIGLNQTANFANDVYYKGQNNFSSYGERYAADAAAISQETGMNIDQMLNSSSVSLGTKMALYTYLIDTVKYGGNPGYNFESMAMYNKLKYGGDFLVNQENWIHTKGGITDLSFGYAANLKDKYYFGGSVGIPFISYRKESTFRESDATGNTANYFSFSELSETSKTNGVGFNIKLGAIIKPTETIRLGFAIHTPSWYTLTDTYDATMTTNTENYGVTTNGQPVTAKSFNNNETPSYKYALSTPWHFLVSGSYVFREVADVSKQKGFITADVEYVTTKSNKFSASQEDDNYDYKSENSVIKSYYKNSFNFRVGGELKFTTLMTRLGFAYYGNPYADKALKANKMFLSGGLGYRNKGMFIDLTYVHAIQKDVSFPYRLSDKANTFANINGTGSNVYVTVGFKI